MAMLENIGKHYILNGKIEASSEYTKREYTSRIYEVIRIVNGEPLFLADHFERLSGSSALIGKTLPMDRERLSDNIASLIEKDEILNNNVMLIIYYHEDISWYVIYFRKSFYPCIDMYKDGVETSLIRLSRNMPNAKILNMDYRTAVANEIMKKKVFEVILVDEKGALTEGSKTNVFFFKNGAFYTAPEEYILKGITRKYIIGIIRKLGYDIREKLVYDHELNGIEGAFLTGTSVGVLPIRQIDDMMFDSAVNDAIIDVHKSYNTLIKTNIRKCIKG
jgi:branched-chain amino acid aminotransferase